MRCACTCWRHPTLPHNSSHKIFRLKTTQQDWYGKSSNRSLRQRLTIYAAGPDSSEWVQQFEVQSLCWLPLTTARRRLGTLVFACKLPSAYDSADLDFLRLVANQVAVAVDNALAFQEIAALKDQLSQGEGLS